MALSMASCGSQEGSSNSGGSNSVTESQADNQEKADTKEEAEIKEQQDDKKSESEATETAAQTTEKPSLLPTGTYELNLPDDIVLEYNGKSVSVVNTTGMALVEEFGVEPTDIYVRANANEIDKFTNGLPQEYSFKIEDSMLEDVYLQLNDRYYNDDYTDIRLQSIDIGEQNREEIPEVKLFGFGKETTFEDVYSVLGTPNSIGGDEKGYDICELQYKDVPFGDITLKIYVVFYDQQYEGMNLKFNY